MTKLLSFCLLFAGFLLVENLFAQQFTEKMSGSLLKIMYGDIEAADLDGDGDQDLIISGKEGLNEMGSTCIYLNHNGIFYWQQSWELPDIVFSSISVEDVDKDGDLDIFLSGATNFFGNYTDILINNGSGLFTELNSYAFVKVAVGSSVFFDADGDGSQDLFYFGRTDSGAKVSKLYLNNGAGQFANQPVAIPGFESGSVVARDYDKDGDLDLLISGESGNPAYSTTKLFNNDGHGIFTDSGQEFAGIAYGNAVFSDIDNDEDLDVILNGLKIGVATYHSQFYLNDGAGNYSNVGNRGLDSLRSCAMVLADVDMDGDEDIFLTGRNKKEQDTCALYYNENGFFTKDQTHYSQGLAVGGALFLNIDDNCSPDLIYFGFGDFCFTQTYCFLNTNKTECPEEEIDSPVNSPAFEVLSNPFSDRIRVNASSIVLKAAVYDVSGRLIYEYFPNSKSIDILMAHVESGIYNLKFTTQINEEGTLVRLLK